MSRNLEKYCYRCGAGLFESELKRGLCSNCNYYSKTKANKNVPVTWEEEDTGIDYGEDPDLMDVPLGAIIGSRPHNNAQPIKK